MVEKENRKFRGEYVHIYGNTIAAFVEVTKYNKDKNQNPMTKITYAFPGAFLSYNRDNVIISWDELVDFPQIANNETLSRKLICSIFKN
jgi:hypothetical protein